MDIEHYFKLTVGQVLTRLSILEQVVLRIESASEGELAQIKREVEAYQKSMKSHG